MLKKHNPQELDLLLGFFIFRIPIYFLQKNILSFQKIILWKNTYAIKLLCINKKLVNILQYPLILITLYTQEGNSTLYGISIHWQLYLLLQDFSSVCFSQISFCSFLRDVEK